MTKEEIWVCPHTRGACWGDHMTMGLWATTEPVGGGGK